MTTILRATTELVTVAWLHDVVGDIVATTLPRDNSTWAASGFVTVATIGGSADPYVPMRSPVVSVDCWAVAPSSGRPPWNKASVLAERIQAACWDHPGTPRLLTLPGNYPQARVLSAYSTYEPRRVPDDEASYARINLGLSVNWVEVTP
ncbi:hypothetical protein ACGFZP_13260 [Kitasatospora sp. NPDC048239]|uniref:hypothetical protein n=1 Tax=Kitasatospora sp. NPDC048239 TaxID=3364046 RepID=UPI0037210904